MGARGQQEDQERQDAGPAGGGRGGGHCVGVEPVWWVGLIQCVCQCILEGGEAKIFPPLSLIKQASSQRGTQHKQHFKTEMHLGFDRALIDGLRCVCASWHWL